MTLQSVETKISSTKQDDPVINEELEHDTRESSSRRNSYRFHMNRERKSCYSHLFSIPEITLRVTFLSILILLFSAYFLSLLITLPKKKTSICEIIREYNVPHTEVFGGTGLNLLSVICSILDIIWFFIALALASRFFKGELPSQYSSNSSVISDIILQKPRNTIVFVYAVVLALTAIDTIMSLINYQIKSYADISMSLGETTDSMSNAAFVAFALINSFGTWRQCLCALFFSLGSLQAIRHATYWSTIYTIITVLIPLAIGMATTGYNFACYMSENSIVYWLFQHGVSFFVYLAFYLFGVQHGSPTDTYSVGHVSKKIRYRRRLAIENYYLACSCGYAFLLVGDIFRLYELNGYKNVSLKQEKIVPEISFFDTLSIDAKLNNRFLEERKHFFKFNFSHNFDSNFSRAWPQEIICLMWFFGILVHSLIAVPSLYHALNIDAYFWANVFYEPALFIIGQTGFSDSFIRNFQDLTIAPSQICRKRLLGCGSHARVDLYEWNVSGIERKTQSTADSGDHVFSCDNNDRNNSSSDSRLSLDCVESEEKQNNSSSECRENCPIDIKPSNSYMIRDKNGKETCIPVAVKTWFPTPLMHETISHFQNEALLHLRVSHPEGVKTHPNIVKLYGICQNPPGLSKTKTVNVPNLAIVMEFCERDKLSDVLNQESVSKAKAFTNKLKYPWPLCWMLDIASGLAHLHGTADMQQVAHLDLKSENILVTSDWRCKIADFGMSLFTKGRGHTLTGPGSMYSGTGGVQPSVVGNAQLGVSGGTPGWMSPEQLFTTTTSRENSALQSDSSYPTARRKRQHKSEHSSSMFSMSTNINNRPSLACATDIYALGVVFWEIFTWRKPFLRLTDDEYVNVGYINFQPSSLDAQPSLPRSMSSVHLSEQSMKSGVSYNKESNNKSSFNNEIHSKMSNDKQQNENDKSEDLDLLQFHKRHVDQFQTSPASEKNIVKGTIATEIKEKLSTRSSNEYTTRRIRSRSSMAKGQKLNNLMGKMKQNIGTDWRIRTPEKAVGLVHDLRRRPPIPDNCPKSFRLILESCWQHDPKNRPTALQVVHMIKAINGNEIKMLDFPMPC